MLGAQRHFLEPVVVIHSKKEKEIGELKRKKTFIEAWPTLKCFSRTLLGCEKDRDSIFVFTGKKKKQRGLCDCNHLRSLLTLTRKHPTQIVLYVA